MLDILVKNGLIADGSGRGLFKGDLGVKDGKIVLVSGNIDREARETVDARGLIVAPGFIDSHTHSDTSFILDERCQSKLFQGVTSEITGQCGSSPYPCSPADAKESAGLLTDSRNHYNSVSLRDFIDKCDRNGKRMSTNLLPLVGHGSLREAVMGCESRPATLDELERMKTLLRDDLETGAWGMSLGLGYSPGVSSTQDELNELGAEVAAYGGIVTAHMRNQGGDTPKSLEEMFNISRYSGVHVHISHFKVSGKANWGRAGEFIEILRKGREAGVPVSADVYPYRASSSGITSCWPNWAIQGGSEAAVERTRNKDRVRLLETLNKRFQTPEDGDGLFIVDTQGLFPQVEGKTIRQISDELGMSMSEAVLRITEKTAAQATCISFSMCDEDVLRMLSQNEFVIGSDGSGYPLEPERCPGKVHPRNFGTFPRFFRIARENKLCSIETAVRRVTGLAAELVGLHDRGLLWPGMAADITIFDWDCISDNATFSDPIKSNDGIAHVIVNGRLALSGGCQTSARGGKILLKRGLYDKNIKKL